MLPAVAVVAGAPDLSEVLFWLHAAIVPASNIPAISLVKEEVLIFIRIICFLMVMKLSWALVFGF
jgi:hypothetical protein